MILPPVLGEFDEELVEMSNYNSISKKKKKKREVLEKGLFSMNSMNLVDYPKDHP